MISSSQNGLICRDCISNHSLFHTQLTQSLQDARVALDGHRVLECDPVGERGATLHDRALEQVGREWGEEMQAHTRRAGTLPKDRDPGRVAAKVLDVVVDPAERQILVQQALVARRHLVVQVQEAEYGDAVVEADKD